MFKSHSGELRVTKETGLLTLDFPVQAPILCESNDTQQIVEDGLQKKPSICLESEDLLAVFDNEDDVLSVNPNFETLKKLNHRGIIVTAPSKQFDFVARFFAPKYGIPEDPVTGSAYTQLVPYWSSKLNKTRFHAKQVSKRGGELHCELKGERVLISGKAVTYMEGSITI